MRAIILTLLLSIVLAPATADAQTPPDVVRSNDGGMLRGTIIEHVPESHVRIVLTTGEERRVEASDIQWAGPASEMPAVAAALAAPAPLAAPPPQPAPAGPPPVQYGVGAPMIGTPLYAPTYGVPIQAGTPVSTAVVPVHFEVDREDVRIDVRVGTNQQLFLSGTEYGIRTRVLESPIWQQLCVAPCAQDMAAGRFQIGVSHGSGRTYLLREHVAAHGPSRVRIHWEDRYAFRVVGALASALIGAGGTAGAVYGGINCAFGSCGDETFGLLVTGAIVAGLALAVGIPFALLKDTISFDVSPLADE